MDDWPLPGRITSALSFLPKDVYRDSATKNSRFMLNYAPKNKVRDRDKISYSAAHSTARMGARYFKIEDLKADTLVELLRQDLLA